MAVAVVPLDGLAARVHTIVPHPLPLSHFGVVELVNIAPRLDELRGDWGQEWRRGEGEEMRREEERGGLGLLTISIGRVAINNINSLSSLQLLLEKRLKLLLQPGFLETCDVVPAKRERAPSIELHPVGQ